MVASHAPPPPTGPWACALTGNQTSDPLVLRLALNPLSHTSQGSTVRFFSEPILVQPEPNCQTQRESRSNTSLPDVLYQDPAKKRMK